MTNELLIGWYDPGSHRFCYTDVKENMSGHKAYTVPVYARIDDDISKLKERIKELESIPRCPCGGELEGLGYDKTAKEVVFECKKCHSQLLLPKDVWEQALKG